MPGIQDFTYANFGVETVRGTPVAPTRQFYGEGTGVLEPDWGIDFHEGENSGRRLKIRRATSKNEDVNLKLKSVSGIGFDDLVVAGSFLAGGTAFTGAGADKSYAPIPSLTAANNPKSYSIDAGDDTQNWRVQYAMARKIKLSAALGGLTQLEYDLFGQRAVKVAKANPAVNNAIKIPAELWTIKFAATFAGLTGASVQSNFLQEWELDIDTGLLWDHSMDGNLYGSQHVETDIAATLTMKAESTALAVSEWYDKAQAVTMDFIRLRAQGPALGGSFYSAQLDLPVLYEVPSIIESHKNGINLYKVVAHLADDGTNGLAPTFVTSMTALP
jgi:hypothetical protein